MILRYYITHQPSLWYYIILHYIILYYTGGGLQAKVQRTGPPPPARGVGHSTRHAVDCMHATDHSRVQADVVVPGTRRHKWVQGGVGSAGMGAGQEPGEHRRCG